MSTPADGTTSVTAPRPATSSAHTPLQEHRAARVAALVADMTLEEKLAQLVGLWMGAEANGAGVAPMQDSMESEAGGFDEFARNGLGQFTRPFGTAPIDPQTGRDLLARHQRWLMANTRHGVPAIAHEECLTGLAAWQATTYPAPPAWGATFDPQLIETMGAAIGANMRSLGVHQGLAPVLDVVRDARWGRVEECIAEDPYVVGTLGTAYIRGLQSTGVLATLKHFVGYSNSRAGRNLAPVHAGPREIADVLLFPFEMAVFDGEAASVMNSYSEIDGLPVAADESLLTGLLRNRWGFEGTVVADYFSVAFLQNLHAVAAGPADAAVQALTAGIDVELPTGTTYLEPLAGAVRAGVVDERLVDRALTRVLEQKARLGLLDDDYTPEQHGDVTLDSPANQAIAAAIAEESIVLLSNDGILPLAGSTAPTRVAVIGPNADTALGLFGCYAFANHVLPQHPDAQLGLDVQTIRHAIGSEFADADVRFFSGCSVDGSSTNAATADAADIAAAAAGARQSDVAVVVVGDRAGLFGRGTSGEGCDATDLELPGAQRALVEAVLDTGTPVILVLVTGRPYAVGWARGRAAAVMQAFFPGQEGAAAVAGVLSGRVNPSGRLPMSMPNDPGASPYSYLHPALGAPNGVSNIDTTPAFAFGHGLSYAEFEYDGFEVGESQVATDGAITASVRVRNVATVTGDEVVQLYASDPVASITRPLVQLVGYARVRLGPGESARVTVDIPTRLLAFSGRDLVQRVEPGHVDLSIGRSCAQLLATRPIDLVGSPHPVRLTDRRTTVVTIERQADRPGQGTSDTAAPPAPAAAAE